ncbi:hypothetical protein Tco_0711918 [Tanacetum coccineum]
MRSFISLMATTDKESSAVGTDTRPPMLEESDLESWKIRIERYIRGKPLGKLIWKSIKNRPCLINMKVHQRNTKFVNNLPLYWGKYVTIVKNSNDISTVTQSTSSPSQYVPLPPQYAPTPQHAPQSTNDAMLATMNQIITIESVQRRAPGNKGKHAAIGSQGKVWFKDKTLLMEAKEKGVILDAEAEAFLADVECTTPYAEPLAITTTMAFEVSHEDAHDSDVDEAPHAAAAFMANLMQSGPSIGQGTSNDIDFHSEVHTFDNHFFGNMNL